MAGGVVQIVDGRLALLVEIGPEHGLGPIVVDPAGEGLGLADPDGRRARAGLPGAGRRYAAAMAEKGTQGAASRQPIAPNEPPRSEADFRFHLQRKLEPAVEGDPSVCAQ